MSDYVLYRMWDSLGRLLYVGRTVSPRTRLRDHETSKDWFGFVHEIRLEYFDSAEELDEAERIAIIAEHPAYNIKGSLRAEIAFIGQKIDAIYGNPPGTALRGIYFWHWPPEECGPQNLEAIYRQAQILLRVLTENPNATGRDVRAARELAGI